jgi:hypothetical protein
MHRGLALALIVGACGEDALPPPGVDGGAPPEPDPDAAIPIPEPYPRACRALFAQDLLPTFEIEIAESEWEALRDEYVNWQEREAMGLDLKPYHPLISFTYEGETVTDAMIRLRGNPCCSWVGSDKMQFQISFNEVDHDGRFRGLRKIVLDGPRYNRTYLRDRLALAILRDAGIEAPCANNARLVVNGTYYGLYSHIEKVDREFLERNFPDPDGNLYKKGHNLKTNEETADTSRMELFWDTYDPAGIAELVDLEQAILEWAGEAMIPNNDGYWAGGGNFYLYDDPTRGKFVFIPWDYDSTFEVLPPDTDPLTWQKPPDDTTGRPHFEALMAVGEWRALFIDSLEAALDAYDPDLQLERIDAWAAQIREAAEEDPHSPFSFESHLASLDNLRAYIGPRVEFLRSWIGCTRASDCE